jgi:hypothetical protein
MFQLNPSIPVVTADGKGEAIGWIDYGKDDELLWIDEHEPPSSILISSPGSSGSASCFSLF